MKAHPEETSSSEFSEVSEDGRKDAERWDIAILHDHSTRDTAVALADVLYQMCGLQVPIMDRDVPADSLELEGEIQIIKYSTMAVVLAGGKISRRLRLLIHNVAKRPSTVTLLVEGQHVPKLLTAHRSLHCPDDLMASFCQAAATEGWATQSMVDSIYKIFSFLVGVKDMKI